MLPPVGLIVQLFREEGAPGAPRVLNAQAAVVIEASELKGVRLLNLATGAAFDHVPYSATPADGAWSFVPSFARKDWDGEAYNRRSDKARAEHAERRAKWRAERSEAARKAAEDAAAAKASEAEAAEAGGDK